VPGPVEINEGSGLQSKGPASGVAGPFVLSWTTLGGGRMPTALDNGQLAPKHWLARIVRKLVLALTPLGMHALAVHVVHVYVTGFRVSTDDDERPARVDALRSPDDRPPDGQRHADIDRVRALELA
jgi:hypothetical protein